MATKKNVYNMVLLGLKHDVTEDKSIVLWKENAIVAVRIHNLEDAELLELVCKQEIKDPAFWFRSDVYEDSELETITVEQFDVRIAEFLK